MKYSPVIFLVLLSLLWSSSPSGAMVNPITIDVVLLNDVQIFFINDFNFTQSGTSPLIFRINITNSSASTLLVALQLAILYEGLTAGTTELARGETMPFNLPPGITIIDNQNLFSLSDQYKLKDYSINQDAAEELLDAILASGKLPSGNYKFDFKITDYTTPSNYDEEILEINISNPTTLDLIAPGEPANSVELTEIYTTLPLFQWESDATQFELKVCEKLSTNTSPEDVMNNTPRLHETDITPVSVPYLYPPAKPGVYPLEAGRTYYWQVTAITPSSSGPVRMESEIYGFKIIDTMVGFSSALQMQILNNLKIILGEDVVNALFTENGELANFTTTGIILKSGAQISLGELNSLINKFLAGEAKVSNYSIE